MVLSDDNVEEYVTLDMTEIDIRKNEIDSNLDPNIQIAVQNKLDFRKKFARKVNFTNPSYMLKVLKKIFPGKHYISDPEIYKKKLKDIEKSDKLAQLRVQRQNSSASSLSGGSSLFLTSNKSSSKNNQEDASQAGSQDDENTYDDQEDQSILSKIDKIIAELKEQIFDRVQESREQTLLQIRQYNFSSIFNFDDSD